MLFQFLLTKFFKSELFLCLPKVDYMINLCKRPNIPRSIATPPLDEMQVHHRVTPKQYLYVTSTHLYTWVKRETKWKKVPCPPPPSLDPRLLSCFIPYILVVFSQQL